MKVKLIVVLFAVFFFALTAGCSSDSKENTETSNQVLTTINSINHRGFYTAPENTLSAFKESAKRGFKMVECDVSFTKDGYAVLLHDNTVDRTSNGSGSIGGMTLEEVRKLDFGSWKSEEFKGEKIPTFEEFIALCKSLALYPYIEIKIGATVGQINSLVQTVTDYEMTESVTWISFSFGYLNGIREVDSGARLGYLCNTITEETVNQALLLKNEDNEVFLNCNYTGVNTNAVTLCVDKLIPLEVWTVNTEREILGLNPYISGVTSDKLIAADVINAHTVK